MPKIVDDWKNSILRTKVSQFRKKTGRLPNEEEKKEMESSAWAIAWSKYK